jgi:hypothetical protein
MVRAFKRAARAQQTRSGPAQLGSAGFARIWPVNGFSQEISLFFVPDLQTPEIRRKINMSPN